MEREKVLIMGAAGRDFHNFNVVFRNDESKEVVAFTATQIPHIEGRRYPPALAGPHYPEGIPILPESDLEKIIKEKHVSKVVFAYSDVSHDYVMHLASRVIAAGPDFTLLGSESTMIKAKVPLISICAVRTGCGKSQTSRYVATMLRSNGKKVVSIRHPMPYGDLEKQKVQRFAEKADLDKHHCTIEEMEEYEPHIEQGGVVYAGVDYGAILDQAEKEADIVLWDGGNNDLPFYKPDLHIVVVDPHRPGHELMYHPGEANLRMADVAIINKVDTASPEAIGQVRDNISNLAPNAEILEAESPVTLDRPEDVKGKRVLVIEDGPTLTHGGMKFGAGVVASKNAGAGEIIDPRPFAKGEIAETYKKYPNTGAILPAMGYGEQQIKDLAATIDAADCDIVVCATPINLARVIDVKKPMVRATYELKEKSGKKLADILARFM
ncbi:MAG: GTPase [Deltaproteobacteria bacterium]|nr:GTPase [Deltaproteobacteria bacterium]